MPIDATLCYDFTRDELDKINEHQLKKLAELQNCLKFNTVRSAFKMFSSVTNKINF